MSARSAQAGAVQGADEDRKGAVQESTASANRSQQRGNAPASNGGVGGSADKQNSTVRDSVLNQYEIAVLYHPDLEVDLTKAEERVKKLFTDNGGKITATDNWGKRKLAYPFMKQEHAVYVFYTVEVPAAGVRKIESTLNITDEVIRYLITRPDLKKIAKAEATKAEKAKKAAERGDRKDSRDDDRDNEEEDTKKPYNRREEE